MSQQALCQLAALASLLALAVQVPYALEDFLGLGAIRLGHLGDAERAVPGVEIKELAEAPRNPSAASPTGPYVG
jgi:hypothetical protein